MCHFRVKHHNSKIIVSVFPKILLSIYCSIWASLDLKKRQAECEKELTGKVISKQEGNSAVAGPIVILN